MSWSPEPLPAGPDASSGLPIPAAWRAAVVAGETSRETNVVRVPVPRFWEAVEYDRLPAAVQREFGLAAVAWAAAVEGADAARDQVEERPYLAAAEAARERVLALFDTHVLHVETEAPGVPTLLGRVCGVCGCSDHDAARRDWVRQDLCIACADGAEVAPRARAPAGAAR